MAVGKEDRRSMMASNECAQNSLVSKNGTERVTHLRLCVFAALPRNECHCADVVRRLQLGLSNGQRVVRDRRSDETALGVAGHWLLCACRRLRMGRLEVSRREPTPARRRRFDAL